jgi:hypothetical protein
MEKTMIEALLYVCIGIFIGFLFAIFSSNDKEKLPDVKSEEDVKKPNYALVDNVRCYGDMNEYQNTWFVTDDDDEEHILAEGFNSWEDAIRAIRKIGYNPVEVMGV